MRLILLAAICVLSSCSLKMIPIKGTYPNLPISETTSTTVSQVWDNLIDFISQRGFSIKLIDRSSGFLVMDDHSFAGSFSTENKKGFIEDRSAYLVTSGYKNPSTREIDRPDRVTGNFNVRIRKQGDQTLINVNLTNLRAYDYTSFKNYSSFTESAYQIKSTGVFEKMIIDYIK